MLLSYGVLGEIFFGILFFSEVLTFNSIVGIVLIIFGVFITITRHNFKFK